MVTMLGWGSWANTQKLAGKERWPFPLFYWDYALGLFLFGLLFALTAGSLGTEGQAALLNLTSAATPAISAALISGALFNLANVLLGVGIDMAGMTVAFPVGVGLALVIGTIKSYLDTPRGNPALLGGGVLLIALAILVSARASATLPGTQKQVRLRGVLFAVVAGCLMGLFYPKLISSISPNFNTQPIVLGTLTPYTAALLFGLGVLASNLVLNTIFMRVNRLTFGEYFRGSLKLHAIGLLGGAIWMMALCTNVVASGTAGPAVSYALGQGATLVAAIWGVFVWKEFATAPKSTFVLVALMFLFYAAGLVLVGWASLA